MLGVREWDPDTVPLFHSIPLDFSMGPADIAGQLRPLE